VRRRSGLNRIGLLAIVLLIALGAMGVTYGAWVDEIYIDGTLSTSAINTSLGCGTSSIVGNPLGLPTSISCSSPSYMKLDITIEDPQPDTHYYYNFIVSNAADSLPVKITSMSLTGSYTGATSAIENLTVGTVIDPGYSVATGRVHIYVGVAGTAETELPFALTVNVARWNK
jgi:hypothetical protein